MRTIRLYGWLGKRFGREFVLAVRTPREAVRALCTMVPGFREALYADTGVGFHVRVGREFRGEDGLALPFGEREVFKLIPATVGSGAAARIVVGAVLIVAGYFVGLYAPPLGTALIGAGISMILGGVIELLSPKPKRDSGEASDRPRSYTFGSSANTTGQGVAVPVGYGRMLVPSHVVSAQVFTEEMPLPGSGPLAPGDLDGSDTATLNPSSGAAGGGADFGGWQDQGGGESSGEGDSSSGSDE